MMSPLSGSSRGAAGLGYESLSAGIVPDGLFFIAFVEISVS
jgi:hypothetical protein